MKKIFTLSIINLFYCFSFAQSLQLDTSFNSSDLGFDYGKGFVSTNDSYGETVGYVHLTLKQPDGKIIVAGDFTQYNTIVSGQYGRKKPFRINNDGSIDPSFNFQPTTSSDINGMELQTDGKIILIGNFNVNNVNYTVLRLNPDGSVDNSFQLFFSPGYNDKIKKCLIQPDGKIIVAGQFASSTLIPNNSIIRVNNDGSLDPSFNPGGNGALFGHQSDGVFSYVDKMILQPDGKIIITGNFGAYNGVARKSIARLNTDGTIDLGFNPGSGFSGSAEPVLKSLTLQPDGKLLVGGLFSIYNGNAKGSLVRINTDGSDDSTFVTGLGFRFSYFSPILIGSGDKVAIVNSTVILSDGRIVVGGAFERYNGVNQNSITCLNQDGSIDTTFNSGIGLIKPDNNYESLKRVGVFDLNVLSNEKILISGRFARYDNTLATNLAKVDSGGNLDLSFYSTTGFDEIVKCSAIQPDGKILVGGYFTKYNNTKKRGLVRLNTDGSIDNSFAIGSGIYFANIVRIRDLSVRSITIQPDNKILIAGSFSSFNGVTNNCMVRLNSDGTIDTSFSLSTTIDTSNQMIFNVVLQNDGKILLFANDDGDKKIYRLNSDGSIDNSFTSPFYWGNLDNPLFFLQSDGKILIIKGSTLKRINSNGTLDASFNSVNFSHSNGNVILNSIDIQTDNKIIIAGRFANVNGNNVSNITRLNSDGTLDYSFYPTGLSFSQDSKINSIKIMPNGKILIGGLYYSYNNQSTSFLYRLNSTGGFETGFSDLQIEGGDALLFNQSGGIQDINIQSNGYIYIGGDFSSFGTEGRNRFARLTQSTLDSNSFNNSQSFKLYPNPTEDKLNIEVNEDCAINSIQIFNSLGQKVITVDQHHKTIDVSNLNNGIYFINMNTSNGTLKSSFIKK